MSHSSFVYVLPQAEQEAKNLGASHDLKQLAENCRARVFDEADQLFEKRFPYRYRRMGNRRVVAKVAIVNGYPVICILHILKKGSREATEFNADPRDYGEKWLEPRINQKVLADFVATQTGENGEDEEPKPELPETLYKWWLPFEKIIDADDIIMESERWVRTSEIRDYSDFWQSYYNLVNAGASGQGKPIEQSSRIHVVKDSDGRSVYYASFSGQRHNGSGSPIRITYLISPFDPRLADPSDFEQRLADEYSWTKTMRRLDDADLIARHSRRGYPEYILAADTIWHEIEGDDVANLALSGEEARLLSELRHAPNGTAVLPVFINGRAGSGKSTILYYLFADYYWRKTFDLLNGEIVFLTYGDRLLESARQHVSRLLKTRVDFLIKQSSGPVNKDSIRGIHEDKRLNACFQPFLKFVRTHVPSSETKRFPVERFVDFRRFKQLYLNRNLSNEFAALAFRSPHRGTSVDVSWHIVRSFIKGYRAGEYLSPEDYAEIPQKERTVSVDLYEHVYTNIWEKWYKLLTTEQGFWDAQDLTREVLQNRWVGPQYAVVFCDEAQDFTRVELDFILQLLVYRQYDLGWQPRVRLPFALAGDPFQTLNPTGFRWEAIKASFYDEIVGNLDPEGRGIVEFKYEELSYNYRSEAPIVRLSNLFQLWREVLFEGSDIQPQQPWRVDQHIIPPLLFVFGESITVDRFADLAQNSVVIVPCEQGQEDEFIADDDILTVLQSGGKPLTVLSPMSAKGLEFQSVILYKFGEHRPEGFFEKLDFESRLGNEYFLNKLYVAATRAMHSLIAVDTVEGKERFWTHATDNAVIDEFVSQTGASAKWQDHIGKMTMGDIYKDDFKDQNPLKTAESLRRGGEEQHNSDLMRQAMDFYRRNGREQDALYCEARALEFDGVFQKAGVIFEKIGQYSDSESCFWRGFCWPELTVWYADHSGGPHLHRMVTKVMTAQDASVMMGAAEDFLEMLNDGQGMRLAESQVEESVIRIFNMALSKQTNLQFTKTQWLKLSDLLDYLEPMHEAIGHHSVALVHSQADMHFRARKVLEAAGQRDSELYCLTMAKTVNEPGERIHWYIRMQRFEDVITEYRRAPEHLDAQALQNVAEAFQNLGNRTEAIELLWSLGEFEDALKLLYVELDLADKNANRKDILRMCRERHDELLKNGQFDIALDLFKRVASIASHNELFPFAESRVEALVESQQWEAAIGHSLDSDTRIRDIDRKGLQKIRKQDLPKLRAIVVKGIARSSQVADYNTKRKQVLSDFVESIERTGYPTWKTYISVNEMGAAIERLSRYVEILPFYEEMEQASSDERERTFLRERWLKVKTRQIDRIEDDMRASSSQARDRIDTLQKRQQELKENAKRWKIELGYVASLPEYPDLGSYELLPMRKNREKPSYKVEWKAPTCKIEQIPSGDMLFLNTSNGTILPFGNVVFEETALENGIKGFMVSEWRLEGTVQIGVGTQFLLEAKEHEFHLGSD